MTDAVLPDRLREQRANPTVLKVRLAQIRESCPCALVIVVEGKDDVPAYEQWIRAELGSLDWEPLVANGKEGVLRFRDLLLRDKMHLRRCTFFIIDHDYDGARGRNLDDGIYVLPAYSIENYLALERVFSAFLKLSLQIPGGAAARNGAMDRFRILRDEFVQLIAPCCAKLLAAKRHDVGNIVIDDNLEKYFEISIDGVRSRDGVPIDNIVKTDREIPAPTDQPWLTFLADRDVLMWVRGKSLMHFFRRACFVFFEDCCSARPSCFLEPRRGVKFDLGSLDFSVLASRSSIPPGFGDVVRRWISQCEHDCVDVQHA
jgi:hypothetical protein